MIDLQKKRASLARARKRWLEKNHLRQLEMVRAWRLAHPDRVKAHKIAWKNANLERWKELERGYRERHKESGRLKKHRRRCKKLGAPGKHTITEWTALCESLEWRCAYCYRTLTKATATKDHKIPLSRGGSDSIDNITLACHSCNSKKSARTSEEYRIVETSR